MSKLILIRHGEAVGQGAYNGRRTDPPLSETGREQVRSLKRRLYRDGLRTDTAGLFVSPMRRAGETADILFGSSVEDRRLISVVDDFAEIDFGEWDGLSWQEITDRDSLSYTSWLDDPVSFSPPGGETLLEFNKRVMHGIENLPDDGGEDIAITAHGGVIRSIICCLLELPPDRHLSFKMDCASYTILQMYVSPEGRTSAFLSALNR